MEVDILDYTMRGILSMKYEDGRWRLVVFLSKLLNETKIWDLWQENIGSYKGVRKLETFFGEHKIQV